MIWTPAKTMKKSPQTSQEQEASQNTEFIVGSQRKHEYGVPAGRIHYRFVAKTRSLGASTQNSLEIRSENANVGCQNEELTIDSQRKYESGLPES